MKHIVLIAHNVRSTHNVGSLLRTADGLGIERIILSGYTPYPQHARDTRLPHEAARLHKQIQKTALGAEASVAWEHVQDILAAIERLRSDGYSIFAIEQTPDAQPLPSFDSPDKVAVIVGREVEGIEPEVIALCDGVLEIPMFGEKESFNVAQAAAMALYQCRFSR